MGMAMNETLGLIKKLREHPVCRSEGGHHIYMMSWETEPLLTSAADLIESLIAQLAECYRLSGADPDGDEDWRLAIDAVKEVARMRNEYDELERKVAP